MFSSHFEAIAIREKERKLCQILNFGKNLIGSQTGNSSLI